MQRQSAFSATVLTRMAIGARSKDARSTAASDHAAEF